MSLAWLQADDVAVFADEEHLRLALSNLLSNAVAAAPDGTALELSVVAQGDQGVFSLRDHGLGVPAYAWPQLGQRFFSLPSHRTGQKGSGLGLAIVRQVVARYGGRLTFEDARPGLRAQLQLPLA